MKKVFLAASILLNANVYVSAQDNDDEKKDTAKLAISGYAEAYYSYDLNNPSNHLKPGFIYNYNRHNELNLNLAYVKANYSSNRVRGNVALMAGTYAQYNLASEAELLRYLYEANVGVRIGKNLWVDAGILPSHIGFESAVGKDCYTLTRSLLAENSPYYEAGAKITWSPNDKWTFSAMYLNGWQRIRKVDGNQTPSFGTQLIFKPSDKVTLNYSTYIGSDKPDSTRQMRYFNDLYGNFTITDNFSLVAGLDYGFEQKEKGSGDMNQWYSPVVIARYTFTDKLALAGRVEYYSDERGVIISTGTPNGFKTSGYSLNLDVTPVPNVLFRIEGRLLHSKDEIFLKDSEPKNNNASVTTSLAFWF
jgi:hypothetical protein